MTQKLNTTNPWIVSLFKNQYFAWFMLLVVLASHDFMDRSVALWVHQHVSGSMNHWIQYLCMPGYALYPLLILVLLSVVFKWLWKRPQALRGCLYLIAAIAISGIACDLLKIIFGRARPDLLINHHQYGFMWFQFQANKWSFPSGHSTTASALFVGIGCLLKGRFSILWLLLALVVASARVLVSAHYPADVLAGFYLGGLTSAYLYSKFGEKK